MSVFLFCVIVRCPVFSDMCPCFCSLANVIGSLLVFVFLFLILFVVRFSLFAVIVLCSWFVFQFPVVVIVLALDLVF